MLLSHPPLNINSWRTGIDKGVALNAKLNGFLEKYAKVCPLNKFDKKRRFRGERKWEIDDYWV